MHRALPRLVALVVVGLVAACGGHSSKPPPTPPLTWTWVPIPGTECSDGSETGIGIDAAPNANADVIVFLDGGGACWDPVTCWQLRAATYGGFGAADLDARLRRQPAGSIFDRNAADNPYKDFTMVFVPYCTGDVHSGDSVQTYAGDSRAWHHKGRVNVAADFAWLATNVGDPAKVVVSGSSAGGFGSLLAFTRAKAAFPTAKRYLVDDSGPPLDNIPTVTIAGWVASWNIAATIADVCGTACAGVPPTLAPMLPELAKANPGDRFALLSFTDDPIIEFFFSDPLTFQAMSSADFLAGLTRLDASIEAVPTTNAHSFVVTGSTHTMLGSPGAYSSQSTTLFEWLSRQVNDEAAWAAATPF